MRLLILAMMSSIVVFMAGCVAAPLIAAGVAIAPAVSGTMDNDFEVSVGEMSPTIKSALFRAKVIGVIADDRSTAKAADIFESRGGYIVKLDRQAAKLGEMTSSERRDVLSNLCNSKRPDVAVLGRTTKMTKGSTLAAAFTGRAKMSQEWIMDLLVCSTNKFESFGGVLSMNIGIYNGVQQEIEDAVGAEIGNKILAAVGRGGGQTGPASPVNTIVKTDTTVPASNRSTPLESSSKMMSTMELQQRLNGQGYKLGAPDGVMGRRTADALRAFQNDNKLSITGLLDEPTNTKLLQKTGGVALN